MKLKQTVDLTVAFVTVPTVRYLLIYQIKEHTYCSSHTFCYKYNFKLYF
jgi:hypothetical protein